MFNLRAYLTNTCLACFDLTVTAACFLILRQVESGADSSSAGFHDIFEPVMILGLWLVLSLYFGTYRSRRLDSPLVDLVVIFKVGMTSWLVAQLASAVFPAFVRADLISFRFVVANFLVLTVARSVLRICLRDLRRRGYNVKRLVLIASEELGARLEKKISRRSHYGYHIVARLVHSGAADDATLLERAGELLRSGQVDDVILALSAQANKLTAQLVSECESLGINVRIVPDLCPLIQTDTQIYDLDGIPLVNARVYPTEYLGYIVFKRAFDLCLSVAVLVILSPLFLMLAVLIKLTSPGPVFFTQDRVGMNGKKFRIIKFRSMFQGPSLDPDSHWTVSRDQHITPLGRWLRRTNLDELPQFLNVLKGEMSIVGPRPERPFFLERFRREVPEYMARHYVKSGITGWAQVNGWRGDTPIPERVAHDLYYIRNWAVSFDIKIVLLTLARTFFSSGAGLQRE
jgi:exopolysaccharide biosynthesis polyprenyl glycosylphosphotransferase